MIEAPEALFLSEQINEVLKEKKIVEVVAGYKPHRFTFYYENPEDYPALLLGKTIGTAYPRGGMVEINVEDTLLIFSDGANLTYLTSNQKLPRSHQLLIGFEDDSCLAVSMRMYGGIWCLPRKLAENPVSPFTESMLYEYYSAAKDTVQLMSDEFTEDYFSHLIIRERVADKSVKGFLATNQTIPGLGNGVLQDILYKARIHPRTKINLLSEEEKKRLYESIKSTLQTIYLQHGRCTESDLFGKKGKYVPLVSKDKIGTRCERCGKMIQKDFYLGGSIYICPYCQKQKDNSSV